MTYRLTVLTSFLLAASSPTITFAEEPHAVRYVKFLSLHETPLTIAGRVMLPEGKRNVPFVVVLHGSGGPSLREEGYQNALAEAGIGSLAIDEWSARGISGQKDRPNTVMETLPDVYGARQWLIDEMEISPAQIGVMGFSFGGVASMLVATEEYSATYSHDGENFAAAMPVYPVCWIYGTVPGYDFARLDTLSVEILTGSEDGYDDDPATCPELVSRLTADEQTRVKVHVLKGAHHSFDKPGSDRLVDDPYSHRGTGGVVQMRYDPALTQRSHAHAVDFFKRNLEVE